MDSLDDSFFKHDGSHELTERFERMIKEGESSFYEVDDLEELLDHYTQRHRLEFAFKVLEILHQQYPTNKQLAIKEAELLSLTDKHTEALNLLSEIEYLEGFNPDFYITKASILSQTGHYEKAISCLHRALDCTSNDIDAIYINLSIEHQNLEQFDEAIAFLKKALEINPENEDAIYEIAYCFELGKKHGDAVRYFTQLIDLGPYNSHVWFNLGAACQAEGNFEKAQVAFDYVIIIDDNFHAAYFNKANVLVRLERYEEAIDLYKKALSFEILDSLIYFYIGDCYDHLGNHKKALAYFEKATKKDDTMAEAWIGASSSLDMLERELEALEYAKRAIEIDNENGDYWCYLAGLQMKYDLHVESAKSFEHAIESGYTEPDLWEDYIQLALSLNDDDLALSIAKRGHDLYPDHTLLRLYQSVAMYRTNQEEKGFEQLVELLITEPSLIQEFILYFPKGIEIQEIQHLIETLK